MSSKMENNKFPFYLDCPVYLENQTHDTMFHKYFEEQMPSIIRCFF